MSSLLSTTTPKILVVDDLPHNLRLLEKILTDQGYEVRLANGGKLALTSLSRFTPDLIILDILMPEIDGYEVCQEIKADVATAHIPVIFVSALSEGLDKAKAFRVGGADYITKPFQVEEVLARVQHHLKLVDLNRQLKERNEELENLNIKLQLALTKLEYLVNIDGLTQVANRRYFDTILEQEWNQAKQQKSYLGFILCDVDYFKQYNDYYGHLKGDDCLIQIAQMLSQVVKRSGDLVARYGGEEFALILPKTNPKSLITLTEKIQERLVELAIPHECSDIAPYVTLSLGGVSWIPEEKDKTEDLIQKSDRALYLAKHQGRNRTVIL
ncbi:diguanylate cyclase [Spirulina subsalsa FACHB-351]|uniref:Diguanylate cyclase n=1 Tax=Spirulina subsalsa FACHB-351 TaxID=234711 RepID=A0ABT3L8K1_9CYAN|nr:diguanylate cyclase [Spirulina subsalsa]MCW6037835.1 diguanylate cyclase [Spirulina subsalsa FACHB-351]